MVNNVEMMIYIPLSPNKPSWMEAPEMWKWLYSYSLVWDFSYWRQGKLIPPVYSIRWSVTYSVEVLDYTSTNRKRTHEPPKRNKRRWSPFSQRISTLSRLDLLICLLRQVGYVILTNKMPLWGWLLGETRREWRRHRERPMWLETSLSWTKDKRFMNVLAINKVI